MKLMTMATVATAICAQPTLWRSSSSRSFMTPSPPAGMGRGRKPHRCAVATYLAAQVLPRIP